MSTLLENRYGKLRRQLDEGGYYDSFGIESLSLVETLFRDLKKTSRALEKTLHQLCYFKQISEELEDGARPFKEENVQLIKENSQLRMEILRTQESSEDALRHSLSQLRALNFENKELRLLSNKLVDKVKKLEEEGLQKSKQLLEIQEKTMDCMYYYATPCNYCYPESGNVAQDPNQNAQSKESKETREKEKASHSHKGHHHSHHHKKGKKGRKHDHHHHLKDNEQSKKSVQKITPSEFGPERDKNREAKALDYIKLADNRIEALQVQVRCLKNNEADLLGELTSMKNKVTNRDAEIEKLQSKIRVQPGNVNVANFKSKANVNGSYIPSDVKNRILDLKASEIQLEVLQKRNQMLEERLKSSILNEHDKFMNGKIDMKTRAEKEFITSLLERQPNLLFPTEDNASLRVKLEELEARLSKCCKEKAKLKSLLEKQSTTEKSFNFEELEDILAEIRSNKDIPQHPVDEEPVKKVFYRQDGMEAKSVVPPGSLEYNASDDQGYSSQMQTLASKSGKSPIRRSPYSDEGVESLKSQSRSSRSKSPAASTRLSGKKKKSDETTPDLSSSFKTVSQDPTGSTTLLSVTDSSQNVSKSHGDSRKLSSRGQKSPPGRRASTLSTQVHKGSISTLDSTASSHRGEEKSLYGSSGEEFNDTQTFEFSDTDGEVADADMIPKRSSRNINFVEEKSQDSVRSRSKTPASSKSGESSKKQKSGSSTSISSKKSVPKDSPGSSTSIRSKPKSSQRSGRSPPQDIKRPPSRKSPRRGSNSSVASSHVDVSSGDDEREKNNKTHTLELTGSEDDDEHSDREEIGRRKETESARRVNSTLESEEIIISDEGDQRIVISKDGKQSSFRPPDKKVGSARSVTRSDVSTTSVKRGGGSSKESGRSLKESLTKSPKSADSEAYSKKGSKQKAKNSDEGESKRRTKDSKPKVGKGTAKVYESESEQNTTDGESESDADFHDSDSRQNIEDYGTDDGAAVERASSKRSVKDDDTRKSNKQDLKSKVDLRDSQRSPKVSFGKGYQDGASGSSRSLKDDARGSGSKEDSKRSPGVSKESQRSVKDEDVRDSKRKPKTVDSSTDRGSTQTSKEKTAIDAPSVKDFEREISQLRNRLADSEKREQEYKIEFEKYRDELNRLQGNPTFTELRSASTSARIPLSAHRALSLEERPNVRERELEQERNDLRDQVRRLESRIRQLQSTSSSPQSQSMAPARTTTSLAKLQEENRTLRRKLQDAEMAATQARREAQQSSNELNRIQGDYATFSEQRSSRTPGRSPSSYRGVSFEDRRERPLASRERLSGVEQERDDLRDQVRRLESRIRQLQGDLSKSKSSPGPSARATTLAKLEEENRVLRRKLKDAEIATTQARREAQQSRTALDQTESMLGRMQSRQSTYGTREAIADLHKKLRTAAEEKLALEAKLDKERETLHQIDEERQALRDDLDRREAQIRSLQQQLEDLQNARLDQSSEIERIRRSAELNNEHATQLLRASEEDVAQLRNQVASMRRELETVHAQRNEMSDEVRRLSFNLTARTTELDTLRRELADANRDREHLRETATKYLEEVKQYEELLALKEKELEELMVEFRKLASERDSLMSATVALERHVDSGRADVQGFAERNLSLANELQERNRTADAHERVIEDLSASIAALETKVKAAAASEAELRGEIGTMQQLLTRDETEVLRLRERVSELESENAKLKAIKKENEAHINIMIDELKTLEAKYAKLEELLRDARQKHVDAEKSVSEFHCLTEEHRQEIRNLRSRIQELENSLRECRIRSTMLTTELEQTRQKLKEKEADCEAAMREFNEMRQQIDTSSLQRLLEVSSNSTILPTMTPRTDLGSSSPDSMNSPNVASTSRQPDSIEDRNKTSSKNEKLDRP